MPIALKIGVVLTLAIGCIFAALWQLANVRGLKARGRRRRLPGSSETSQRSSDRRRKFSRMERKLFQEAQHFLEDGKVQPAAALLEQLSMQREAIQVLEDHGFIHDAAKILMRMQRHNRAGVVYARHAMWENAARCFKMANMPAEVAKCAREFGDNTMACEYFEKAEKFGHAAECAEELSDNLRAARLYLKDNNQAKAMSCYSKVVAKSGTSKTTDLRSSELQSIASYVADGHGDGNLAKILHANDKLLSVIQKLLAGGMANQVKDILTAVKVDIAPQLMADINYSDQSAPILADVLSKMERHQYAGMIYEQLQMFDRAAVAFEKAGDPSRASYCRERAGLSSKSKRLPEDPDATSVIQPPPPRADLKPVQSVPSAAGPSSLRVEFALAAVTEVARPKSTLNTQAAAMADVVPPPLPIPPAMAPVADDLGRSAFVKSSLCTDLSFEQSQALWDIGVTTQYAAGETILGYSGDPRGIYVVLRGQVSCFRRYGDKDAFIDQLGAADSFGELWLLADNPSAVQFVALRDVDIRIIDRVAFLQLLERDSTIACKLYKRFAMRLLDKLLNQRSDRKNPLAS
ncbi:MAG: cyclic nucleotide-binding domain-containing protein [Deltaproteobacteria bacterium]|nr:cyclic nucleotide-binding domain-containing protein [Deltaproteobacteria bacterium]